MSRAILLFCLVVAGVASTPRAQTVRPLSTDRPDRTESPYTVPKGWLQVEMDVVTHGELENRNQTVTGTGIAAFNLKYGVTPRLDLQVLFTPWVRVQREEPGIDDTDDGTGQAGLRAKFNLTGNDGSDVAAALLPFVMIPTRGDAILDAATWGIMTPVTVDLGNDRAMGSMLGAMRVDNEQWWAIGSVTLASPIAGDFGGFVEMYVASGGFDDDDPEDVTFDFGLTYAPSPDWQFDTGVYYGVTDPTEDWRVFAGASARFPLSR